MKQQTFIAKDVKCLNPWDTQQSRVFSPDGVAPTAAGADGGGGRNPAGLVFCSASSQSQAGITKDMEDRASKPHCRENQPIACEPEIARTLLARGDSSPCADRGQNVVAVSVHQNGTGELSISDTAKSLTTISTGSCRNAPLVAHPDIAGTLCASGAGLSRLAGMASEPDLCVAYALQGNMIGREDKNGPGGSGISENVSFALTTTSNPAVASAIPIHDRATRHKGGGPTRNSDGSGNGLGIGKDGDPSPTLTSGDKHAAAVLANRAPCTQIASGKNTVGTLMANAGTKMWLGNQEAFSGDYFPIQNYIVRRLTPTECERLQGFPDGWTRYGHDGKEISDTRRYQFLGNSVAVPCVAYILSGMAAYIIFEEGGRAGKRA